MSAEKPNMPSDLRCSVVPDAKWNKGDEACSWRPHFAGPRISRGRRQAHAHSEYRLRGGEA